MIQQFIDDSQRVGTMTIDGMESLSVGEKVSLFFKEGMVGIDRRLAGLKASAHKVDYDRTRNMVKGVDYFAHASDLITTPAFFDPNTMSWETYVKGVCLTPALLSAGSTEAARFYLWLKELAKTGVMGRTYHFSITSTDGLVQQAEDFVGGKVKNTHNSKSRLNQCYNSFSHAFGLIQGYNVAVSTLKARDIELFAKDLSSVSNIGNLIAEKIKDSSLVLKESDLLALQNNFVQFVKMANIVGAQVGLLNELHAVFNSQLDEMKKMK